MNFIFFGRLTKEKGFDLIVRSIFSITEKTGELPGNIFIFGEGDGQDLLFQTFQNSSFFEDCSLLNSEEISEKISMFSLPEEEKSYKIYFFGWQSQESIRNVLRISHFSLMPSRFLETFGLSALESLSEGVPVLGFQKGGLISFIPKEFAVHYFGNDEENIEAFSQKILEVSEDEKEWGEFSHQARRTADIYTQDRWLEQVRDILPKDSKKILLVSDYITILGGIETHIQTIAKILRQEGYEVEVTGWNIKKGRWIKLMRLLGLVYSFCNITSVLDIRKKIHKFQPDVIWLHSVSRFLGPWVVREVNKSDIFSLMTYHDLGLWTPFPSMVEDEIMIPRNPGIIAFLEHICSKNPLVYIAGYCKYIQIFILGIFLRKIDIHIVPSDFLVKYPHNLGGVSDKKIRVLEHFL